MKYMPTVGATLHNSRPGTYFIVEYPDGVTGKRAIWLHRNYDEAWGNLHRASKKFTMEGKRKAILKLMVVVEDNSEDAIRGRASKPVRVWRYGNGVVTATPKKRLHKAAPKKEVKKLRTHKKAASMSISNSPAEKRHTRLNGMSRAQESNPLVARNGEFVTVETEDGQMYVGTLSIVDAHHVIVNTNLPGRNMQLHCDDIEEVVRVNSRNKDVQFLR